MQDPNVISIIIAIAALIISSISLLRQYLKERARFTLSIEKSTWDPPVNSPDNSPYFYIIIVDALLRNNGGRDTTIHTVNISFTYNGKQYDIPPSDQNHIIMPSGHAQKQHFLFYINKNDIEITKNPTSVKLSITHTFGEKSQIIKELQMLNLGRLR